MHTVLARDLAPEAHGELLMNVGECSRCSGRHPKYMNECSRSKHMVQSRFEVASHKIGYSKT